jgi:ribosome-associated protein
MAPIGQSREVFHDSAENSLSACQRSNDLPHPCLEGGLLITATLRSTPTSRLASAFERAILCAQVARDNKGKDILVLDMREITPLYDFFVIVTGTSRRQIHTLAEETDAALTAIGDKRIGIEGYQASKWVIQDYSDILVHVFDPDTREYYKLEELWADAKRVDWENEI